MTQFENVTLTNENMSEVLIDPNVYGLRKKYSDTYSITHITECEVGDLINGKYELFRITEE